MKRIRRTVLVNLSLIFFQLSFIFCAISKKNHEVLTFDDNWICNESSSSLKDVFSKNLEDFFNFSSSKNIYQLDLTCTENCQDECTLDCICNCEFGAYKNILNATQQFSDENVTLVAIDFPKNVRLWIQFRGRILHGTILAFEPWFEVPRLSYLVRFKEGLQHGDAWKLLPQDGYLVSRDLNMDGKGTYVYPGFEIGLHGRFIQGSLVSAKAVRISNLKCEDPTGFPSLNLESSDLDTIFYPDISSDLQLSKFPLLKDPLEDLYVEVRPSTIKAAGEGLFLKKAAKAGTVVGFFNGVRVNVHDTLRNPEYEVTPYKVWNDWDDNDELLSILTDFSNVTAYNATLGHKINHSPEPNTDYGFIDHPRFGKIRSVITTKDLPKDSELFCGYAPTVDGGTFVNLLFKDFLQYLDLDEESQEKTNYLKGMKNDYKKIVDGMLNFDLDKTFESP